MTIHCLDSILEFIIHITIVLGIFVLIRFYIRLALIDKKIEQKDREFEKERNQKRGQGRGICEEIINLQIEKFKKDRDESIAPLDRERARIISKVPFLK